MYTQLDYLVYGPNPLNFAPDYNIMATIEPIQSSYEDFNIPYHRPVEGVTVTACDGKVIVRPLNTPYKPDEYVKYSKKAGGYVMNYKTFADFWYAPYGKPKQGTCTPSPLYNKSMWQLGGVVETGKYMPPLPKSDSTLPAIDSRWNTEPWKWEAPTLVYDPAQAIETKYAWIEQWESDPKKCWWRSTIANGKANRRAELAALNGLNVTAEFEKLSVNA